MRRTPESQPRELPDADALEERLDETQPHPVPVSRRALPLAAIGLALAFALFGPPLLGTLAPWVALGGVAIAAVRRARTAKRQAEALRRAEELSRLRRPADAFFAADALLDELVHEPGPSAGCVHLMARSLQALGRPDACRVATEVLLDRLPPHHPARAGVLLNRAIAEFESDRLADGDGTLGRVRSLMEVRAEAPGEDPPWLEEPAEEEESEPADRRVGRPLPAADRTAVEVAGAAFRVARLIQSVMTYHAADAVADAEAAGGAEACFRPLGVDAGFAHGLLAWCHLKLHDAEGAAAAWSRATLLVPAAALVHRFPRLGEVAEACPSHPGLPA